jgi:hypothetical protein
MSYLTFYGKSPLMTPLEPHEVPAVFVLEWLRPYVGLALLLSAPFLFNYAFGWVIYHWQHKRVKDCQLPPEYPTLIPYVGGLASLLLDGQKYLTAVT